MKKLEEKT